ncbi:alpha/beta fold hydrolase [Sutterella sp.]|uniref:alpha/beta fold hydrolase n=1 Tax=Sutterella sp. TaxID=1981025 RepID=UPI0026DF91E1|nr:alpha/beta hydrolase [Sutterella sp.]MDO5532283.1 alpha/beta hydrolase [Sutterella sp.]
MQKIFPRGSRPLVNSRRTLLEAAGTLGVLGPLGLLSSGTAQAAATSSAAVSSGQNQMHSLRYFMQTPELPAFSTPYGDNAAAGHHVSAGDVTIYYETYGDENPGEPVLVLHGGGVGCAYEMGGFIDELRKTRRVIIPSTRGHGRSGFGTELITYEQKALDMMAVVRAEGLGHAAILGFSDGAYTAYRIAEMFPEFPTRIVAIGAGENIPGLRQVVVDLDALEAFDPPFIAQQLALQPRPDKARWKAWLKDYGAFYSGLLVSKNIFMRIKAPVLLVSGELDGNAPLDTVLAAWREIPEARLAIIPGAPHPCFITNFDAVWAGVKPFLGL